MSRPRSSDQHQGRNLRLSAWNLLLLIPLFTLITPLYNHEKPRLGGMPFFYWFQFLGVPIGVVCTVVVYRMTRGSRRPVGPDRIGPVAKLDEGELDEGSRR